MNEINWMQQGWECPKCGAVMAPTTSCCVNCRGTSTETTITTTNVLGTSGYVDIQELQRLNGQSESHASPAPKSFRYWEN